MPGSGRSFGLETVKYWLYHPIMPLTIPDAAIRPVKRRGTRLKSFAKGQPVLLIRWLALGAVLLAILSCGRPAAGIVGSSTPATSPRLASPSTSPLARPEARQGGILVKDPGTGHLLLVGGIGADGARITGTWSWDGKQWTQLNIRSEGIQAAFLDPQLNRVLALQLAGQSLSTTSWSGAWGSLNSAHAPPPMVFGSGYAVFNPNTNTALYCGIHEGLATQSPGLEVWIWNGNDWLLQGGSAPFKRDRYALAYDPVTKADLLFGGEPGGGPTPLFGDTWSWNGSSWTQLKPAHRPATGAAYATFDEQLNALVLLDWEGNLWSWTGSDWNAIPTSGSGPGAYLSDAAFGYDAVSRGILVFGGATGDSAASSATWLWVGAAWTRLT